MYPKIILKHHEEQRLLAGHLWIFSNEIARIEGAPAIGDTVEAFTAAGQYLGKGFYNPHSLIAFRLLTRGQEEIDDDFFRERIAAALAFRRALYPGQASFRLVFGESDLLPGLIVDKYGDYCAVQFLSAGMEKNRSLIVTALEQVLAPAGIVGRNDSALRRLEGLEEKTEVITGTIPPRIEIEENGCRFAVDLTGGQKTGFFFDQRENRAALARYCEGKKVIDCFCHTGAFGIEAAAAGAAEVVGVDSSAPALRIAEENARLNNVDGKFSTIEADVMAFTGERKNLNKFDIIILDPPALIKSRKHFQAGYRAYRKLNTSAIESIRSGGLLATSSCSHHLSPEDFRLVLKESAAKARRQVRLLELRSQGRDHPVLLSMPETEYLKCAILEIV